MRIKERVKNLLKEIPKEIKLVAATKTRNVDEIKEAIEAGIEIIGENYVQEAEEKFAKLNINVKKHMIGHLQKNKAGKALEIFDMIETVDNIKLATIINKLASKKGNLYPLLIEINIGKEEKKSGVIPEEVSKLIKDISKLKNVKVEGLMTMGPFLDNPEELRPFFKSTKTLFEELKYLEGFNIKMKYLSMGMSSSWRIAIEEGANIIRLGTQIFGSRKT